MTAASNDETYVSARSDSHSKLSSCVRSWRTGRGSAGRWAGNCFGAGTSIGANVQEAEAGQSPADFISKYAIARKDAREANYWLRLLRETAFASGERIENILDESHQLTKILTAIIKSAEGSA